MSRNAPKKDAKATQPMDATAREVAEPVMATNNTRVCHAIKTLVAEVRESFPETPVEYSAYDGRNTALAVSFDLTGLDEGDAIDLTAVLRLIADDHRVEDVTVEDDQALVTFKSNARTQDDREPFGLVDALSVLSGEGFEYGDEASDALFEDETGSW